MRRSALWIALSLLSSCRVESSQEPAQQGTEPGPSVKTEPQALFGVPHKAPASVPCTSSETADLKATIAVRVFAPADVDPKRLLRHTQALEELWGHWGVAFTQVGTIERVETGALFVAAGPKAAAAVRETEASKGPLSKLERETVMAPFVTAPLRQILGTLTPTSPKEVQLFFVDRITATDSPVSVGLRHPAGLTFSPFTAAAEAQPLERLIGINPRELPAPIVFLSLRELSRLAPNARTTVLAHEFGHAFGLEHGGSRENLMQPRRHARCTPSLDSEQLAVLQSQLTEQDE